MKKQSFVLTLGVVMLAVAGLMGALFSAQARRAAKPGGPQARIPAGDYHLSGPYTHKNLSIFLVHGKSLIKA